jgi:hypothetical protein
MGLPLEVVVVGKKNIIGRIHIKYEYNMVLKIETYGMNGKILKN